MVSLRLAEVREKKGIKQAELARRMNLSRGQIANIEAGRRQVDLNELRHFARILNCSVVDLLLPTDAPNAPSETESAILSELRQAPDYDPRAVIAAVRAVISAANSVRETRNAPRMLNGNPRLANALADQWNSLDDPMRQKLVDVFATVNDARRN